jgi:hypothetical protein
MNPSVMTTARESKKQAFTSTDSCQPLDDDPSQGTVPMFVIVTTFCTVLTFGVVYYGIHGFVYAVHSVANFTSDSF